MADFEGTVYLGHDNALQVELLSDGASADLAGVTHIVVDLGSTEIDSADNPTEISWENSIVTLRLGNIAGMADLGQVAEGRLIVYTNDNTNGIVWLTLRLTLEAEI